MAKKTAQVDIQVTGGQSIQDIENELAAVNEQLKTMDVNSEAFAEMATQAQALDGQLQAVNKELSYISPAEQADGFLKMGEGILGSVAAVQGLSAAFGVNNEAMEETIKKLVGLVAAMDGIRKVSEALQKENLAKMKRGFESVGKAATKGFKAVGKSLEGASNAFSQYVGVTGKGVKIMNTALTGFVITAILVALTIAIQQVIKHWDDLVGIFSKSQKAANDAAKDFERLTGDIEKMNNETVLLTDNLKELKNRLGDLSTFDLGDVYDSPALTKFYKELKIAEAEMSVLQSGTREYLQGQIKVASARLALQNAYRDSVEEELGLEAEKQSLAGEGARDLMKLYNDINTLKANADILDKEKQKAEEEYLAAVEVRKAKEAEYYGSSEKKIARKSKSEVEAENSRREAFLASSAALDDINSQLQESKELYVQLATSSPWQEELIKSGQMIFALKDANQALLDYDKTLARIAEQEIPVPEKLKPITIQVDVEVNEASLKDIKITPTVDPTNWEQFIMNVKMDVGEIKFNTEQWGSSISEFSTTYLEPLANEFNNIIMASADLYAAEQENVIALAELKIEMNQEVIDAEMEKQEELQDLINDNNDQILDYEDLLKDANAERYAEIQAKIVEEQQANAELQLQKDESDKKELAAMKAKEKAEYEMALAVWKIKKNDLEAARVTAVVNGALAVINALGNPFPLNIVMPILIGIATAVQVASISKNISAIDKAKPQPPKAAKGMLVGPSHEGGGIPIEAEGGEFIVNKRATAEYLPLIEAINNSGNRPKYADGGQVTATQDVSANAGIDYDQLAAAIARSVQPVVSVVEITDKQNKVRVIEQNATL